MCCEVGIQVIFLFLFLFFGMCMEIQLFQNHFLKRRSFLQRSAFGVVENQMFSCVYFLTHCLVPLI